VFILEVLNSKSKEEVGEKVKNEKNLKKIINLGFRRGGAAAPAGTTTYRRRNLASLEEHVAILGRERRERLLSKGKKREKSKREMREKGFTPHLYTHPNRFGSPGTDPGFKPNRPHLPLRPSSVPLPLSY